MIDIEDSVTIDRPVESVFAFATNLANNTCWQTDVILTEQTSTGPFGEGATYRVVNRFMGQYFDSEGIIAEYVPNRSCTYRFTAGPVAGESRFIFEEVDGGTRFVTRSTIELKNFKKLGFIIRRKARHQVRNDLWKLKELLEKKAGHFDQCGICEA
ncbi:MAG: SRPBCC family protein [Desulfobacterales bacterium]